jgi:large subunit ribosomal protein L23
MENVLIKPIITEKMTDQAEGLNTYGFVVARSANKIQIKNAISELYDVNVKSVRTMRYGGKSGFQRTPFGISKGTKGAKKKAYVTLEEGESIDFYSNI